MLRSQKQTAGGHPPAAATWRAFSTALRAMILLRQAGQTFIIAWVKHGYWLVDFVKVFLVDRIKEISFDVFQHSLLSSCMTEFATSFISRLQAFGGQVKAILWHVLAKCGMYNVWCIMWKGDLARLHVAAMLHH